MRAFITGVTGSIGRRLVRQMLAQGDELLGVSRDPGRAAVLVDLPTTRLIQGDPTCPGEWQGAVGGADAVVHLACVGLEEQGETKEELESLRERRLDSMFQVVTAIERAQERPHTLVVLSSLLASSSDSAHGELVDLYRAFEKEALKATELGVRVVVIQLGLLFDEQAHGLEVVAGAGPLPDPVSFIAVKDVAGMIRWVLESNTASGVIAGCSSAPMAVEQMKRQLGKARRRTPRGEWRALLECKHGHPARSQYACQFDSFEDALQEVLRERTQSSSSIGMKDTADSGNSLVVLPCEGFLLNGASLHMNAGRCVERLRESGLSVVLATSCGGKLPLELAAQLGASDPIIAADGSALLDPGLREAIRTESLRADRVSAIATAVRTEEPRVTIIVERGVRVGAEKEGALSASMQVLTSIDEVSDIQALFGRPATRLLLHAPPRRLDRALEVIRTSWWRERLVAMIEYAPDVVAITAPTADRGVALQRAESIMGAQRGSSIVIAATERDAGLLECAELAFALPSLEPRVAEGARSVLASSDPEEVAKAVVRAHQARSSRAVQGAR